MGYFEKPKILFGFIVFICLFQSVKQGDFLGYLQVTRSTFNSGFISPYKVSELKNGDYFQSPITAVLLAPLAWLPSGIQKLIWAVFSCVLLIYLVRTSWPSPWNFRETFFLLFMFTQPISDVFQSGNLLFHAGVLAWIALIESEERPVFASLMLAIAIAMRVTPILFVVYFALIDDWKMIFRIGASLLTLVLTTFIVMGGQAFKWWRDWIAVIPQYGNALTPTGDAFQSPAALLYRVLQDHFHLATEMTIKIVQFTSFMVFAAMIGLSAFGVLSKRGTTRYFSPLLLAMLYFTNPFSWACGMLYAFPLLAKLAKEGISRLIFMTAIIFACFPKALWQGPVWDFAIYWNITGGLAAIVFGAALMNSRVPSSRSI